MIIYCTKVFARKSPVNGVVPLSPLPPNKYVAFEKGMTCDKSAIQVELLGSGAEQL